MNSQPTRATHDRQPAHAPRRVAFPPNWPARIAFLALAALCASMRARSSTSPGRASSPASSNGSRFICADVSAQFRARQAAAALQRHDREPADRHHRDRRRRAAVAAARACRGAQPCARCRSPGRRAADRAVAARFHPVIVAILFVKAVGFGALAGMLALIVASLGFSPSSSPRRSRKCRCKQVEAVRATGSPFLSLVIMGVLPQVMPRFIGFSAYQLDSNLRNSALVGLVGGGGIGATLFTAFQRFDYDFVLTIVLAIIAVVMVGRDRLGLDAEAVPMSVAAASTRGRRCAAGSDSRRPSACMRSAFYLIAIDRGRLVAADDRDHSGISLRRAAADRRPVRAHVADRLGLVPEGRARGADRDAAHRRRSAPFSRSRWRACVALMVARNITRSVVAQHDRPLHPGRDPLGARA